jgi:uncharacterized SAM-binding protein YcdF (DUF218 family)
VGCMLLVLIVSGLLTYLALRGAGAFLITGDPLQKADAVVVLGGGDEQRVKEGVRLVLAGYGNWLVLTEPGELEPGAGPGSLILRAEAIASGLSSNAILVTDQISRSTADEARAVLALMTERKFHSVIVVTEPYHTQRTRLIFQRAFAGSDIEVWVYPVQGHWFRSNTWFLSAGGWGHTIREYAKLLEFVLRVLF